MRLLLLTTASVLCLLAVGAPAASNRRMPVARAEAQPTSAARSLLQNGGFEHGGFQDWVLSGNTEYTQVFNQPYDGLSAHGGSDYALLGPQGSNGNLSQGFADVPGMALTVSFWLASDGGTPNAFSASMDTTTLLSLSDTGAFGWTRYRISVIGTGWDTLSFSFLDDQDYLALDQIRVFEAWPQTMVQAAPEPPSLLLAGPAALAAWLLIRRRRPG